jgi:hypothetical protein
MYQGKQLDVLWTEDLLISPLQNLMLLEGITANAIEKMK